MSKVSQSLSRKQSATTKLKEADLNLLNSKPIDELTIDKIPYKYREKIHIIKQFKLIFDEEYDRSSR